MYIVGFILLVIGALVGFMPKRSYVFVMKNSPSEMDILKTKGLGFFIVILGAILILTFFR